MLDFETDIIRPRTTLAPSPTAPPALEPAFAAPLLLQALLDGLPQSLAVLDAAGGLAFWNAAARERLTAAGWTVAERCLRPPRAAERDALAQAVACACTQRHLQLLAVPLQQHRGHVAVAPVEVQGRTWAMLVLDREGLCGSIELQLFSSSIGLTHAETRVLARLAQGARPAQIAREFGVLPSTVRSQAAALRAKANCASIAELLLRLALLPGLQARRVAR